ncbi:MAG: hypothetical protein Q7S11_01605 [bacterium]|nr:hypothetical protein [bacterium]
MSAILARSYGTPINRIEFKLKIRRKKGFQIVSWDLVMYGDAARTALIMRDYDWYLTNDNYLVLGVLNEEDLPILAVELCLEDGENLKWLVGRSQKTNWDGFYTPVKIARVPTHNHCLLLEGE